MGQNSRNLNEHRQLDETSIQRKVDNNKVNPQNTEQPKQKIQNLDKQKQKIENQIQPSKKGNKVNPSNEKASRDISEKGKSTSDQINESQETNKQGNKKYSESRGDGVSETIPKDINELTTDQRVSEENTKNVKVREMQDTPLEKNSVTHEVEEKTKNILDVTENWKSEQPKPDKKVKGKKTKTAPK